MPNWPQYGAPTENPSTNTEDYVLVPVFWEGSTVGGAAIEVPAEEEPTWTPPEGATRAD